MNTTATAVLPALHKLGTQWVEYAQANDTPAKGKTREKIAHAFAAGAYVAGLLNDSQMFLINVRGSSELERWARSTPQAPAVAPATGVAT